MGLTPSPPPLPRPRAVLPRCAYCGVACASTLTVCDRCGAPLPEVQRLDDERGVFVLTVNGHLSAESMWRLNETFRSVLPGARCIVLEGGTTLSRLPVSKEDQK